MSVFRSRYWWGLGVVVAAASIAAWPLATGAGIAFAAAAIFAGLRASALVVLAIVIVLAALGLRVDADHRDGEPPSQRPR